MAKPTIKDVAKLAGVSVGTVSKVINKGGSVKPELQSKVWDAIKRLEYHPNAVARSLKSSSSHTIAVLLADLNNPFQMTLAKGIEEVTYEKNYQILISSTREKPEIEKQYLQMLYEKRVDGFILCSTGQVNEEIKAIINKNVPVILVDRPIFTLPVDIVADNNLIGMELLVDHLYKLGHTRIGIIHGDKDTLHGKIRSEGFLKAVGSRGLTIPDEIQYDGGFSFEGGVNALEKFMSLPEPPTAIVSSNNNMTAGILSGCDRLNINIPNDLSVVSFGELEYSWDLIKPRVTYVSQSPHRIGKLAAEQLFKRLQNPGNEEISHNFILPKLVIRDSTKENVESNILK